MSDSEIARRFVQCVPDTLPIMRCLFVILAISALQAAAQPKLPASLPPAEGKVVDQYTMRYIEVAVGTGKLAEPGKVYFVHYTGWLYDGSQFDTSRNKPEPLSFEQGKRKVIPGWDAGFEGMRVGGKRRFLIPYQLAYGEKGRGKIPPRADLIFDVELMDVKDPPPDPAGK
jgi:peptidylprolyl isomerase